MLLLLLLLLLLLAAAFPEAPASHTLHSFKITCYGQPDGPNSSPSPSVLASRSVTHSASHSSDSVAARIVQCSGLSIMP